MSLSPNGMPCSGPRERPAAISASAWRAWRRARSKVGGMKARVCASYRSTRRISASVSSTGDSVRDAIRRESSAIERSWRSVMSEPSEGELGLPVGVHQHRVRDVADVDRPHEGELGGERFLGDRILLGPPEPHRDGVPPELLDVLLGESDDLDPLGLELVPGRDVLLLDVRVLVPGVLTGRGDHELLLML